MFTKLNLLISLSILLIFTPSSIAQQFKLEKTIDMGIWGIFDIDGDGICEYLADSNKVYDGATHSLKYTYPTGDPTFGDETKAQNPYSYFPHIDYNDDGKRELIININSPNSEVIVYDISNSNILFHFNPSADFNWFYDLVDIDGDSELELIMRSTSDSWTINKTYIYSTGVPVTLVQKSDLDKPINFQLNQNYPNPFNPFTTIEYQIPRSGKVQLKIYDITGRLIKNIERYHDSAGNYSLRWDGTNDHGMSVSSGSYFYQMIINGAEKARRMILLR